MHRIFYDFRRGTSAIIARSLLVCKCAYYCDYLCIRLARIGFLFMESLDFMRLYQILRENFRGKVLHLAF
jgi:hypothetical protein